MAEIFEAAHESLFGPLRMKGIDAHRVQLGHYILAALELLIVSDIIHTALSLAVASARFLAAHRAIVAGRPHVPHPGVVLALAGTIALVGIGLAIYLAVR